MNLSAEQNDDGTFTVYSYSPGNEFEGTPPTRKAMATFESAGAAAKTMALYTRRRKILVGGSYFKRNGEPWGQS